MQEGFAGKHFRRFEIHPSHLGIALFAICRKKLIAHLQDLYRRIIGSPGWEDSSPDERNILFIRK